MNNRIFSFDGYSFEQNTATFTYSYDNKFHFEESVQFAPHGEYNQEVFGRVLRLCFFLVGTSYFKCFPTPNVVFASTELTPLDAELLTAVYHDGLSQFVFENAIDLATLPNFEPAEAAISSLTYSGEGVVVLQSGGKDSLLLAQVLKEKGISFTPWYLANSDQHPEVIDRLESKPLRSLRRFLDQSGLAIAWQEGAFNGHVPVTYITAALALADAVLHEENTVLLAIGREGNEAHEYIDDFAINHQWSKTWQAEQLLSRYVTEQISPQLYVGSPLRQYTELRIAELFVEKSWREFGESFSSCNVANYEQGHGNKRLVWCGACPKCANSFLLFAPFVEPEELKTMFSGKNLFKNAELDETFKGLLGIDGVMKPFECVGEVDELRFAYHMAQTKYGEKAYKLSFVVPGSEFNYRVLGPCQNWAQQHISK